MFTFILYTARFSIAYLITKCWLVSVAHDGNEHESGLYLSISAIYTMLMQFHFRMEFLPQRNVLTKLAMNLIQNLSQLTNTRKISQALVYSKENLDVKSRVV